MPSDRKKLIATARPNNLFFWDCRKKKEVPQTRMKALRQRSFLVRVPGRIMGSLSNLRISRFISLSSTFYHYQSFSKKNSYDSFKLAFLFLENDKEMHQHFSHTCRAIELLFSDKKEIFLNPSQYLKYCPPYNADNVVVRVLEHQHWRRKRKKKGQSP